MLDWIARRLDVSSAVAATLVVLTVVQLALQVYAFVDLARRSSVWGGRKWLWALAIALGLPGTITYLAAGRMPSMLEEPTISGAKSAGRDAVQRAVDSLYGHQDRQ